MDEAKKGISAPADSKESSSFDGDFGKDFLSSWKTAKTTKDQIDFDVESTPRSKKTTFNFGKLDDFELGGDFNKLSSFKMDMSDLDFCSPLKKTDKAKGKQGEEIVQGKKEAKQDKFSFTFDFNELDKFGLDPNLLKGEDKNRKCTEDGGPDQAVKHDKNKESVKHDEKLESVIHDKSQTPISKSATRTDVSEDNGTKRFPTVESMGMPRSEHLLEPTIVNFTGPSTSDCERQDVREVVTSLENKKILVGQTGNTTSSRGGSKQQPEGSCFLKKYPENAISSFSGLSVAGNSSAQEVPPQVKKGLVSLDVAKTDQARELDDTARAVDSSHSQNSSPANSNNSRRWKRASSTDSPNSTGASRQIKGNQSEDTNGRIVPSESTKSHKDVDNGCAANFSQNNASQSTHSGDKQKICPKLLPSQLRSVQLPSSGLPRLTAATNSVKNSLMNPFSAATTKRTLQNLCAERQDIALKDGKMIPKSSIKTSTMQKEMKPVERKLELHLGTVPKMSNSATTKKYTLSSPSLKRKILEESKTDRDRLNPLKRIMESTYQRRDMLDVSPTVTKKLEVPRNLDKNPVLGTGIPEAYQGNASMDSIDYLSLPEMKNAADLELPILIENDGNVEKAEACAKELDDICNMLRKKNEEAKELLVRAVVNNNALVMLHHPMYFEQIRDLQKKFANLKSREWEF